MDSSQRLSLPFISPGQAQKELYHNEALQLLDLIVAAAVEEPPVNDPPSAPVAGNCFIVGTAPTGSWTGSANALAIYTGAGWRYASPVDGMTAWIKSTTQFATWSAGAWQIGELRGSQVLINGTQVVGAQAAAIADPAGGTIIDTQARTAISAMLAALRQHGLIAAS